MKINAAGLTIIKEFEGLRLESYQDIAGVWTIGYGHTLGVEPDQQITELIADGLLDDDLERVETILTRELERFHLSENEFSALGSLCFNVGCMAAVKPNFKIYKALAARDKAAAADAILLWDKGTINGVKQSIPGLTRRRQAERALFLTPVETT